MMGDCKRCHGSGYYVRTSKEGEVLEAVVCRCSKQCADCKGNGHLYGRTDQPGEWHDVHAWVMGNHEYDPPLAGAYTHVKPCACDGATEGVGRAEVDRRVSLFNGAGIPVAYLDAVLPDYVVPEFSETGRPNETSIAALETIREAVEAANIDDKKFGVLLRGGVGVGKTHLLAAAVRSLCLDHGVKAVFVDFGALLANLRKCYQSGWGAERLMYRLEEAKVLVIDELGRRLDRAHGRGTIDDLIAARANRGAPVWAATNAKDSDLASDDMLGERLWSRMKKLCDRRITIVGDDLRETGGGGARVPIGGSHD